MEFVTDFVLAAFIALLVFLLGWHAGSRLNQTNLDNSASLFLMGFFVLAVGVAYATMGVLSLAALALASFLFGLVMNRAGL